MARNLLDIKDDPYTDDDTHEATFVALDGTEQKYTADAVIRQVCNLLSGHDAACGMDDCPVIEHPASFMYPEPIKIATCKVVGPTTPEIQAANKQEDARLTKKMDHPSRRLGFHIRRNE